MRAPARLTVGVALTGAIVLACTAGPLLLAPVPGDPVGAYLLPPLAARTVLVLDTGVAIAATAVDADGDELVAARAGAEVRVPEARVTAQVEHRYLLGSDRFGRDVLRDLLVGGRVSLAIAVLGLVVALTLGLAAGGVAALAGGWTDAVLMRLVDAALAFPILFLLLLLHALFQPSITALALILGATAWMGLARLVRGQLLSLKERGFILAARACGTRPLTMWRLHYLPHLAGPVGQDAALRLGGLILAEATLSFLGLGVPPGVPSWGAMVAEGQGVLLDGWWLATFPGLAVASLVAALALIGDGVQERVLGKVRA